MPFYRLCCLLYLFSPLRWQTLPEQIQKLFLLLTSDGIRKQIRADFPHVYNNHPPDPLYPSDIFPDKLQPLRSLSHHDAFPAEGEIHWILDNRTLRLLRRLQIQEKRLPHGKHQRTDNQQCPVHHRVGSPGGNQQKVIIGRWLLTNPDYLILDEPTRGIDIGTKTEIQKLVLDLADQGMAVTFISSEVEEMLRTCSRMGVLRDGKKVGEISGNELSQEGIMKAIAGGEQ